MAGRLCILRIERSFVMVAMLDSDVVGLGGKTFSKKKKKSAKLAVTLEIIVPLIVPEVLHIR